jgi:RHS repeat-associated protein
MNVKEAKSRIKINKLLEEARWRFFNDKNYRFGFNGKENDDEVKGDGCQQDYGMRIYDTRLGKFLSVDPINYKFPYYTPYSFAGNKPIAAIDIDGLEEFFMINHYFINSYGDKVIYKVEWKYIKPQDRYVPDPGTAFIYEVNSNNQNLLSAINSHFKTPTRDFFQSNFTKISDISYSFIYKNAKSQYNNNKDKGSQF